MDILGTTYEEGIGHIIWWNDKQGSTRATILEGGFSEALQNIKQAREILEKNM